MAKRPEEPKRIVKGATEIQIGRWVEFTEDERKRLKHHASELRFALDHGASGVVMIAIRIMRIVRAAIARSHAS